MFPFSCDVHNFSELLLEYRTYCFIILLFCFPKQLHLKYLFYTVVRCSIDNWYTLTRGEGRRKGIGDTRTYICNLHVHIYVVKKSFLLSAHLCMTQHALERYTTIYKYSNLKVICLSVSECLKNAEHGPINPPKRIFVRLTNF